MNWLTLNFDKAPIIMGASLGLLLAVVFLLGAFVVSLTLMLWLWKRSGGKYNAAAGIGFFIYPTVVLTGAPWSLWGAFPSNGSVPKGWTAGLAIIGGNLLNGVLIGTLLGSIKKFWW